MQLDAALLGGEGYACLGTAAILTVRGTLTDPKSGVIWDDYGDIFDRLRVLLVLPAQPESLYDASGHLIPDEGWIPHFNDTHTHAEVLARMDEAIARCAEHEGVVPEVSEESVSV